VYAIAMTLLVVGIGLPTLVDQADKGELLSGLGDAFPEIFSFFLSFAVIGTSFAPVVFFLASIPVAFVSTTAAVLVWFLFFPFQYLVLEPRRPKGA
jgi:uncharacterized membrane protein